MSVELKTYLTGLTADGSPDTAADYVMTYDASADALKKVLLEDLGSGGGISGLGSTDNAVVRADGTGGTTAQGSAVTIDDNGSITVPDLQGLVSGGSRLLLKNGGGPTMMLNPDGIVTLQIFGNNDVRFQHTNGDLYAQFDHSSTAGQTRMLVYDVDNATLERVTVGAADSGGSGFKVLRIPN